MLNVEEEKERNLKLITNQNRDAIPNQQEFMMLFPSQAIYERLFCWIVTRINDIIEVKNYDTTVHGKNTVIGVLDIYGFEIFDNNR